jgi:hypothetical protein
MQLSIAITALIVVIGMSVKLTYMYIEKKKESERKEVIFQAEREALIELFEYTGTYVDIFQIYKCVICTYVYIYIYALISKYRYF